MPDPDPTPAQRNEAGGKGCLRLHGRSMNKSRKTGLIPNHTNCRNCGCCCGIIPANAEEVAVIREYLIAHPGVFDRIGPSGILLPRSARSVAQKIVPAGQCKWCGTNGRNAVHHIDHDPCNNNPDNLIRLCRSCHDKYHAAEHRYRTSKVVLDEFKEKVLCQA